MSDIKTLNHNRLFLCRLFDVFGVGPNKHKTEEYIKEHMSLLPLIILPKYCYKKFHYFCLRRTDP